MSNLQFKQQATKVEKLVQDSLKILTNYPKPEVNNLVADFLEFWTEYQQKTKLTIAFIGQYNAGKSTLIKALTGDPTIRISAEICTDNVSEYPWKEVLLVDTPGIYAGRTDHDRLTLDKISQSDLLVFVIPNELFNPQGGDFFRKVSQEMQRVGQMVLVINKMSRETGTPETLINGILEVIEPYHYRDFYTCFIDADSYLQAAYEDDEEEKLFLIDESNFNDFLSSLQQLIDKNELTARLVTPLHRLVELLEMVYNLVGTDDHTTQDLLELLRRKAVILRASQTKARNIYHGGLNELEHDIIMLGEGVASKIDGTHHEEQIQQEITHSPQEINNMVRTTINNIQGDLSNEFDNLTEKLHNLENSLLGKAIAQISAREIAIELGHKQQFKNYDLGKSDSDTFFKLSSQIFQGISNLTSKTSREVIYNVAKKIGIKFKPFEAFKGAKILKGLGPVIAGLGFALDIFLSFKEEQEQKEYEQKLRKVRAEIRRDYREIGIEITNEYQVKFEDLLKFYDEELWDLDLQRNQLTKNDLDKKELVDNLNQQLKVIKQEIASFMV